MKINKAYLKSLFRHFIIWTIAFAFWTFMREFGHEIVREYPQLSFWLQIRVHLSLGIVAGLLFGSLDYYFQNHIYQQVSLGKAILIGSLSYLITVIVLVFFGISIFTRAMGISADWPLYQDFVLSQRMIVLIIYCYIIGFCIDFVRQVDMKFGPGNLWKMLKGEFYNPKEDERIFMFLDLKSSTAIAEQIGHFNYSRLIQDCFKDLEVVSNYHAEIYQYVGDEAVLTWKKEVGLSNSNCLRAYFDFEEKLASRSQYYLDKYGVLPEFKAGLNIGKIIVAEVGQVKREIAYHGDTINTAARIQDQCNEFGKRVLISEYLKERLELQGFASDYVGDILLKGKSQKVNIYSVERRN